MGSKVIALIVTLTISTKNTCKPSPTWLVESEIMSTSVVGKKLFVGNLSYDTSDKQLEEVFSEYGEVKACFTVKERGG